MSGEPWQAASGFMAMLFVRASHPLPLVAQSRPRCMSAIRSVSGYKGTLQDYPEDVNPANSLWMWGVNSSRP
jgi:hypothetical protein